MIVCKFGGTSLANASQIKKVYDIIKADKKRKIVVVSAPGKRFKEDIKVTDLLIDCAEKQIAKGDSSNEQAKVMERFAEIMTGLGLSENFILEVEDDLASRLSSNYLNTDNFIDKIKAAGEDINAKIVARFLKKEGINAVYLNPKDAGLILSEECGNARVLDDSYKNLSLLREYEETIIFPGFFGYCQNGEVVTFPRGGSDITGSILAAAVDAELYENYTDVDSVYAANPNIIENPEPISILTYREMRELSYAGFSILHEETLEPVYKKGIPVCVKNTNNPLAKGTKIVEERKNDENKVTGIACEGNFCSVYVSKYMMNREIGFGRRLLSIFEDENVPYEHLPSGIDNVSIILSRRNFKDSIEKNVINRIQQELKVDDVYIEDDLALVMVVGEGMRHCIGLAARATNAMAKAGTNIEMINQGSSEVSMMFGIKESDSERTVKVLYEEFFGTK